MIVNRAIYFFNSFVIHLITVNLILILYLNELFNNINLKVVIIQVYKKILKQNILKVKYLIVKESKIFYYEN